MQGWADSWGCITTGEGWGTGMCSRTGQGRRASDTCPCPLLRDSSPPTPGLSLATLCSHYGQDGSHACEMWHFEGGLGGALRRKMWGSPDISLPSPIARPYQLSFTLSLSRTGALPEPRPPLGGAAPAAEREAPPPFSGGDAGRAVRGCGRSAERGAPRPGSSAMAPSGKVRAGGRGSCRLRAPTRTHPWHRITPPRAGRRAAAGAKLTSSEGMSVPALENSAAPAAVTVIAFARIMVELVLLC